MSDGVYMVKETVIRISTPNQNGVEHRVYKIKATTEVRKITCRRSNLAVMLAMREALDSSNRKLN